MGPSMSSLFSVINYLTTKAAVSGKVSSTRVRIPYSELAELVGKKSTKPVDLVVTVSLDWDSQDDSGEIEIEED